MNKHGQVYSACSAKQHQFNVASAGTDHPKPAPTRATRDKAN